MKKIMIKDKTGKLIPAHICGRCERKWKSKGLIVGDDTDYLEVCIKCIEEAK